MICECCHYPATSVQPDRGTMLCALCRGSLAGLMFRHGEESLRAAQVACYVGNAILAALDRLPPPAPPRPLTAGPGP